LKQECKTKQLLGQRKEAMAKEKKMKRLNKRLNNVSSVKESLGTALLIRF